MAYIRQSRLRTTVVAGMPFRCCGTSICDLCTLCSAHEAVWVLAIVRLAGRFHRLTHFDHGRKTIEGRHDATFFVRYARQTQAHFDSAQSAREHQVVEAAQMAYTKGLAG